MGSCKRTDSWALSQPAWEGWGISILEWAPGIRLQLSGRWLPGNPCISSVLGRCWGFSCLRCLPLSTNLHLAGGKAMTVPRTPQPPLPSSAAHHLSPQRHTARPWEGPHNRVRLLSWGWPLSSPSGPLSTENSCQGAKLLGLLASPPNLLWQGACPQPPELPGSRSRAMCTLTHLTGERKVLSLGKKTSPPLPQPRCPDSLWPHALSQHGLLF